jgi:MOSC domain-containing protein YiiM
LTIDMAVTSSIGLAAVNVATPAVLADLDGERVWSGIRKHPVPSAATLWVSELNISGDGQADLSVHGGPDKAVYGYPSEHYAFWCEWLGVAALPWGAFGENLTTEGLLEADAGIGDRFRIGSALLEVSQPRIPCHKLALRHARPDLPKHFLASGRSGFYFRVIEPGDVGQGDAIARVATDPRGVSVADVQALARAKGDPDQLRRAAAHPALAEVWRAELGARLRKLNAS